MYHPCRSLRTTPKILNCDQSIFVDVGNPNVMVQHNRWLITSNLKFIIILFYVEFSEPHKPNMKNKRLHIIEIRMNSESGRGIKFCVR